MDFWGWRRDAAGTRRRARPRYVSCDTNARRIFSIRCIEPVWLNPLRWSLKRYGINPPQLVPRHWSFVIAYIVITSVVVAFSVTGMGFLSSLLGHSENHHRTVLPLFDLWLILSGIASVVIIVVQSIGGPLAFTKNMVCDRCHRQQRLRRIPFFVGSRGGYKIPNCECGGDLEPAIFWKLES